MVRGEFIVSTGTAPISRLAIALIAGLASFAAGWQMRKSPGTDAPPGPQLSGKSQERSPVRLEGRGDALLTGWSERVAAAADSELEALAIGLAAEPRGRDLTLWIPLLARWSEVDGAGMIDFVGKKAPASLRENLLGHAWFAWGASEPEKAFEAGRALKYQRVFKLLEGVAETDPRQAAEYVFKVQEPNQAVWAVAARVVEKEPELAEGLLQRAIYDGGRMPLQRERIKQLAKSDPAAAVAYARECGIIGHDPVPQAIAAIAENDPAKALAQIDEMPADRAKALSSVVLAKAWAARDLEKTSAWIRENLDGPTRHYALVAAASAAGRQDPEKAFDLLLEAGPTANGDFFRVLDDTIMPSETREMPEVEKVASDLLRQMNEADPENARRFVREKLTEESWRNLAKGAGVEP